MRDVGSVDPADALDAFGQWRQQFVVVARCSEGEQSGAGLDAELLRERSADDWRNTPSMTKIDSN
jgi:hypothetical protein